MNKSLLLSVMTLGLSSTAIIQTKDAQHVPCKCFCAFKPGPRDKKPNEKPFIHTLTNNKGKTFNVCLCAERDLEELQEHPELIDKITEEDIRISNCCQQDSAQQ